VVLRRGKFHSPQAKRFIEMMDPDFFAAGDIASAKIAEKAMPIRANKSKRKG